MSESGELLGERRLEPVMTVLAWAGVAMYVGVAVAVHFGRWANHHARKTR